GLENAIELVWLRDLDPDLATVRLLRATGDDDFVVLVDALPPDVTRYLDETISAGVRYRYALVAADEHGNESTRSQERSAAAWSLAAPGEVVGLSVEVEDGGVRVSWQPGGDGAGVWLVSRKLAGAWVEVSDLLSEPEFLDVRGQVGDEYLVVSVGANGQLSSGVSIVVEGDGGG